MKAIDLFCGCGGISVGLTLAGFEILAGVDIESKYLTTFSHNFGKEKSFHLDLASLNPSEFMQMVGISEGELDLLAGGPPCQGFSKNVPRKQRYLDAPNNRLIKIFLDYCEALKPNLILLENVAEMKNGFDREYSTEVMDRLSEEGYSVTEVVLNAADYGVPQRRKRTFFLANRYGLSFDAPEPTHIPPNQQINLFSSQSHVTVWDAIGDLPPLLHGEQPYECKYLEDPFSEFQLLMRGNRKTVRNHIARNLRPKQFQRLLALKPGQGLKDLPPELQVKSGYSGAYGRLTKDMISPTITRWVFHPGSGRWGHPVDIRTLSIREVARIQSFPDSFEFIGTYTDQSGQLGNAVPPLLAKTIINSLINQLERSSLSKISRNLSIDNFSDADGKLNLIV
jgi:DNA (cytosine-5)-methyltransferase 1